MKKIIFFFLFLPLFSFSQQWFPMDAGVENIQGDIPHGKGVIFTINSYEGNIIIGGDFLKSGNNILNSTAYWDGLHWQPMGIGVWIGSAGSGIYGFVHYFINYNSKLYVVGGFSGAGGSYFGDTTHNAPYIAKWGETDWFPLNPMHPVSGLNYDCFTGSVYNNNLYVGGDFWVVSDTTGYISAQGIGKWNDTVFSSPGQLSSNYLDASYGIISMTVFNNKLIIGGKFNSINNSPFGSYGFIAGWNDTSWSALSSGFNKPVRALAVYNGELYAGGDFTATGDNLTPLNYVAKWNGNQWLPVGEGLNDTVITLYVDSATNKLFAGGLFTQTGLGVTAKHIAEWTGTNWQEVGGGTNGIVDAIYAKDSNLYIGGQFTQVGNGINANNIACWGHSPLGVGQLQVASTKFQVYPNPNNGTFYINLNKEYKNIDIEITNVIGQVVYTTHQKETSQVNITLNQPQGLYFVTITVDSNKEVMKIVKE